MLTHGSSDFNIMAESLYLLLGGSSSTVQIVNRYRLGICLVVRRGDVEVNSVFVATFNDEKGKGKGNGKGKEVKGILCLPRQSSSSAIVLCFYSI